MNWKLFLLLTSLSLALFLSFCGASGSANGQNRPLEVRIYSSLLGTVSDSRVRAVLNPLVEVVSDRIDYPAHLDVEKGTGPEGVFALGEKLNNGTYHIATVWGLEYGWLLQKYPGLARLAVVSNGDRASWRSQLMVRKSNPVSSLEMLRGKKLARAKYAPLMDQLLLEDMLQRKGQDPHGFFKLEEALPSDREAFLDVKNDRADCVMVNTPVFNRFESTQPKVAQALRSLEISEPYPAPVLIGLPGNLEKLRSGLWRKLQEVVLRIHDTPYGQECMHLWRFEKFLRPDRRYMEEVESAARRLPITRLRGLQ